MKFFTNNITLSSTIPFIDNEQDFMFIFGHLLDKPTVNEHQIAWRIATRMHPHTQWMIN